LAGQEIFMSESKPSAFELAVVAAILSLRERHAENCPSYDWIIHAHDFLNSAFHYVGDDYGRNTLSKALRDMGAASISFAEILKPTASPRAGHKKPQTMLGNIKD